MNPETISPIGAVRKFVARTERNAASFVIIARNTGKTIWLLVVDDPTKYGTTPDGRIMRRIGFPGGKAKPGETSQEAAEREVLEEVGLQINLGSATSDLLLNLMIIDVNQGRKPHKFTAFSTFDFRGKVVPGEDIKRAFWVPVQDLLNRSNLLENHRAALKIFARKYT